MSSDLEMLRIGEGVTFKGMNPVALDIVTQAIFMHEIREPASYTADPSPRLKGIAETDRVWQSIFEAVRREQHASHQPYPLQRAQDIQGPRGSARQDSRRWPGPGRPHRRGTKSPEDDGQRQGMNGSKCSTEMVLACRAAQRVWMI